MDDAPFREGKRGEAGEFSVCGKQGRYIPGMESVVWTLCIFTLCVADAVLTLTHVGRGARELNPLMASLLAVGPTMFLAVKIALSLGALAALATFLPRYRYARACFGSISTLYFMVCCYHLSGYLL